MECNQIHDGLYIIATMSMYGKADDNMACLIRSLDPFQEVTASLETCGWFAATYDD